MKSPYKVLTAALLALMCAYVISYFALVRTQTVMELRKSNRCEIGPGYGVMPAELFAPIHWVDKAVLRPHMWSYVGTMEEYERHMGYRP
jgi:hypothetical protein